MAVKRYLAEVNGQTTEEIPVTTGGSGKEEQIVATGTNGLIDQSLMPTGIGPDTATLVASETLAAGDFVNIWNDGGTPKARKAIAEDSKLADGFVLDGVAATNNALVYFEGRNTAVSGLTPGTIYFLSDSAAGTVTATAPTASNKHVQRIGKAYSATALTTEGLAGGSVKKA